MTRLGKMWYMYFYTFSVVKDIPGVSLPSHTATYPRTVPTGATSLQNAPTTLPGGSETAERGISAAKRLRNVFLKGKCDHVGPVGGLSDFVKTCLFDFYRVSHLVMHMRLLDMEL